MTPTGPERRLLGRSGLEVAFSSPHLTVYSVPGPRPLAAGPGPARVLHLLPARVLLRVSAPGTYRVAIRFSPYWRTSQGCLSRGSDGMLRLSVARAGRVDLAFHVNLGRGLSVLTGSTPRRICSG